MTMLLSSATSRWVVMFTAGLVVGGSLIGGLPRIADAGQTEPSRSVEQVRTPACGGGNEVSAFVCRNTWLASTKHGTR